MIITCPKCFSKYEVPAGAVAANGRVVRCASCTMEWVAYPEEDAGIEDAMVEETLAEVGSAVRDAVEQFDIDEHLIEQDLSGDGEPVLQDDDIDAMFIDEIDDANPGQEADSEDVMDPDDIDFGAINTSDDDPDLHDDDLTAGLLDELDEEEDFMTRKRLQELDRDDRERGHKRSRLVTAGFGLWLVSLIVLLAVLIFARESVTSTFPGMTRLYDFADGLADVELFGGDSSSGSFVTPKPVFLKITPVQSVAIPRGADTWITVQGKIANNGEQPVAIDQLIIIIRDKANRPLTEWSFVPESRILTRGSVLDFETTQGPLPDGFANSEIDVLLSNGKRYSDIQAARTRKQPSGGSR